MTRDHPCVSAIARLQSADGNSNERDAVARAARVHANRTRSCSAAASSTIERGKTYGRGRRQHDGSTERCVLLSSVLGLFHRANTAA